MLFSWAQDEEEGALLGKNESLPTTLTTVSESVFVQGEENTFEIQFEIDNFEDLMDKYPSEIHVIPINLLEAEA
jgi:hypothetical protein